MSKKEYLYIEYGSNWVEYGNSRESQYFKSPEKYLLEVEDGKITKIGLQQPSEGWIMFDGYPGSLIKRAQELRQYKGKTLEEFLGELKVPKGHKRIMKSYVIDRFWNARFKDFTNGVRQAQELVNGKNDESYYLFDGKVPNVEDRVKAYLKFKGTTIVDVTDSEDYIGEVNKLYRARSYISDLNRIKTAFLEMDKESLKNLVISSHKFYRVSDDEWKRSVVSTNKKLSIAQKILDGEDLHEQRLSVVKDYQKDPLETKMHEFQSGYRYSLETDYDYDDSPEAEIMRAKELKQALEERKMYMYENSSKALETRKQKDELQSTQKPDKLLERQKEFAQKKVKPNDKETIIDRRNYIKRQRGRK